MGEIPAGAAEALQRLRALGFGEAEAQALFVHFDDAERRGRASHGYARIPWLEEQRPDAGARPAKLSSAASVDRWHGNGALGYLTLAAICDELVQRHPREARLVVASACFPTGVLGYWARLLADRGDVALVTATSPRRLPHPEGGPPLTGTNPVAIGVPSSDGRALVADVSMGAVTHGDVLMGRALPDELVPFGGPQAHKAFALAVGLELFVGSLAGPGYGAVVLVVPAEHDPVPAFRVLAEGRRLPGDR